MYDVSPLDEDIQRLHERPDFSSFMNGATTVRNTQRNNSSDFELASV